MITEFCCGAEAPKEVEEEKPHDFEEHTYKIITKCDFCRKVLKGMRKQVGLLMLMFFTFQYLESFTNCTGSPKISSYRIFRDKAEGFNFPAISNICFRFCHT